MKEKNCRDCGNSFILKQSEIDFFLNKGLHEPVRCILCRKKNKLQKSGLGNVQPITQPHENQRRDRRER